MNKVFQVAGIQFSIDDNIHQWNEFQVKEADDIQFTISCLRLNMQRYGLEQYPNARQATMVFRNKGEVMIVDSDWKNVLILPPQSIEQAEAFFVQVFHTHAVRRQMLQLHCATIDDDGRGILFLGPSGIGKTTQAERWGPGAPPGTAPRPTASTQASRSRRWSCSSRRPKMLCGS